MIKIITGMLLVIILLCGSSKRMVIADINDDNFIEPVCLTESMWSKALGRVKGQLKLFSTGERTLYNTYSEEELDLLFRIVEAEITDGTVEQKTHVASVIFNRVKIGWWGGDLTRILLAKRQFEVVTNGRYKRMTVTPETVLACEIAFDRDTAQGALFFDSTRGKSWAHENMEFIFSDKAHWFYK